MTQSLILTQNSEPKVYGDDNHVAEGSKNASVVGITGAGGVRLAVHKHDDRECGAAVITICQQTTQNFPRYFLTLQKHFRQRYRV